MNSNKENQKNTSAVDSEAPSEAVPARRRLFKQGAAVVAFTLASRPVLAWHCRCPSAYASMQAVGTNHGSMWIKHNNESRVDDTWTIQNWKDNTSGVMPNTPWEALGMNTTDSTLSNYYKKYKISSLFAGLTIPAGLAPDDSVWKRLVGTTSTAQASLFNQYMIVARLNYKLVTNVRLCLTSDSQTQFGDQLNIMASGRYSPPGYIGTPWDANAIIAYLQANYIVLPS